MRRLLEFVLWEPRSPARIWLSIWQLQLDATFNHLQSKKAWRERSAYTTPLQSPPSRYHHIIIIVWNGYTAFYTIVFLFCNRVKYEISISHNWVRVLHYYYYYYYPSIHLLFSCRNVFMGVVTYDLDWVQTPAWGHGWWKWAWPTQWRTTGSGPNLGNASCYDRGSW